jgi:beta-glucanase (GH16 family)
MYFGNPKNLRPEMVIEVMLVVFVIIFEFVPRSNETVNGPTTTPPAALATRTVGTPSPVNPTMSVTPVFTPTATPTATPTHTPQPTSTPTIEGPEGMHLVLNESFSDQNLNSDLWNTRFRWGDTNAPELEKYTLSSLHIQPGNLSITAEKNSNASLPYTSGMIASYDRFYFQYGYIEIRAKLPKGRGLWPALWLLAQNPNSPEEIDIMEALGQDPSTIYTTIHFKQLNQDKAKEDASITGTDYSQAFHTFAVDWEWNKIVWTIDGKEVFQVTDHISHEPMYIIANLAIGGDWAGSPDAATVFPASFDISYIRVFAH